MMTKRMYFWHAYDITFRALCNKNMFPGIIDVEEEMKGMTKRAIIKLAREFSEFVTGDIWKEACGYYDWTLTKYNAMRTLREA